MSERIDPRAMAAAWALPHRAGMAPDHARVIEKHYAPTLAALAQAREALEWIRKNSQTVSYEDDTFLVRELPDDGFERVNAALIAIDALTEEN